MRPGAGQTLRLEETSCIACGSDRRLPLATGRDLEYGTSDATFTFVRCGDCGHMYLNPRPGVECAAAIYPTSYYTRSGSHQRGALGRIKDRVTTGRIARWLRQLPARACILDAGCGDGALLVAIRRRRPDLRLIGLDLSFAPARRAELAALDIECIEGLLEHSPIPGGLDLIIMNQLIEHLWDIHGALGKMREALAMGGLLVIATPNVEGYDRYLFESGAWGGYYFPRHLNLFSGETLSRLVTRHGFEVVERRDLMAPLVWIGSLRNVFMSRGWRGAGLFRDGNLGALAAFTVADAVMRMAGRRTSNQQLVARKAQ